MKHSDVMDHAIDRGDAGVVEHAARAYAEIRDRQAAHAIAASKEVWPENARALPHLFVRTSLFGLIADDGESPWEKSSPTRVSLFSAQGDIEIEYIGFALSQFDLSVWASIAHMSRVHGYSIETDGATLLRDVLGDDCHGGTKEYERLRTALKRLASVTIFVKKLRPGQEQLCERSYKVLAMDLVSDTVSGRLRTVRLQISEETSDLLAAGHRVEVRHKDEIALARSPLALKLYRFYKSHKHDERFTYGLNTLRLLSGSAGTPLVEFRKSVRRAVEKLVEIGFISEGTIDKRDCLALKFKE